ncbi:hypothetical protein VTH06DRAFT_7319 [Thermothelomyces fergusii]
MLHTSIPFNQEAAFARMHIRMFSRPKIDQVHDRRHYLGSWRAVVDTSGNQSLATTATTPPHRNNGLVLGHGLMEPDIGWAR